MKKLTNLEVIDKLTKIYGDSLEYTKVLYVNSRTPITLICPKHGEFPQYANNALLGRGGCPLCKKDLATLDEFLEKAREKFGDKFNYSLVLFVNASTPVTIICPEHGEFTIKPSTFMLSKFGCSKCYQKSRKTIKKEIPKLSEEERRIIKLNKWIEECKLIHNNKYDYSKVHYIKSSIPVTIICPKHGEFELTPTDHKTGRGCRSCKYENHGNKARLSLEEFEKRANLKWNYKYTYGHYLGMNEYIEVICPEHGSFTVTPNNHLKDCGCPKCSRSSGEIIISSYLDNHNIKYIELYEISIDKNINPSGIAKIDFYLPDYNTFIEYNGIQHYVPIEHFGGELKFQQQQKRDIYVKNYCLENNINFIEIKYDFTQLEIENQLNKLYEQI